MVSIQVRLTEWNDRLRFRAETCIQVKTTVIAIIIEKLHAMLIFWDFMIIVSEITHEFTDKRKQIAGGVILCKKAPLLYMSVRCIC